MAAIELIYGESGWLRVVPCNMDSVTTTQINTLGTKVDFTYAVKSTPNFASPAAAAASAETKYFETTIANGNKVVVADNSKTYLLNSGNEVTTESGSGSTAYDTIECSITSTKTNLDTITNSYRNGTPIFVMREIGKLPSTATAVGYDYMFGQITDYKENPATGAMTIDFTVTAKKVGAGLDFTIKETVPSTPDITYSTFNDAATGAGNTITPVNDGAARTITTITDDDFATIKSGVILRK